MAEGPPTMTVIKEFFSTEDHPVTNAELIELKKGDPEGFEQIKAGLTNGTLTY